MIISSEPLQRVSLRDQLAQRLEQMILSHQILAGSLLPSERELAERWGVSRSVVRDAIRTLESKGLVEVRHGVGAAVTDDARAAFAGALKLLIERGQYPLSELMRLRIELEVAVARFAAQAAKEEDLVELDRHLTEYEDALRAGDIGRVVEADTAFHLRLLASTYNRPLIDLVAPLVTYVLTRTLTSFAAGQARPKLEDNAKHREIYSCVAARDAEGAARWMRIALSDALETIRGWERANLTV